MLERSPWVVRYFIGKALREAALKETLKVECAVTVTETGAPKYPRRCNT